MATDETVDYAGLDGLDSYADLEPGLPKQRLSRAGILLRCQSEGLPACLLFLPVFYLVFALIVFSHLGGAGRRRSDRRH